MKKFILNICIIIIFPFLTSCSKDNSKNESVVGTWELTTWTVLIPMDLDNDGVSSTNLLDEANCDNFETLVFEDNGTVSTNRTYNPNLVISLSEGITNDYYFEVTCSTEGSIGAAGDYTQTNMFVSLFNNSGVIDGNQLTIVYENAIKIYNESLSEVLETKDLTLIYTKK